MAFSLHISFDIPFAKVITDQTKAQEYGERRSQRKKPGDDSFGQAFEQDSFAKIPARSARGRQMNRGQDPDKRNNEDPPNGASRPRFNEFVH
jgi:hypothetical protein